MALQSLDGRASGYRPSTSIISRPHASNIGQMDLLSLLTSTH